MYYLIFKLNLTQILRLKEENKNIDPSIEGSMGGGFGKIDFRFKIHNLQIKI